MRPNEQYQPSPHGSATNDPDLIVVHCMGEYLDYEGERLPAADFLDRLNLSVHALAHPDGTITRLRDDEQGAWHAKGHNTNSLGIEVLVPGAYNLGLLKKLTQHTYLTGKQFEATVRQVRQWMGKWGIPPDKVVRHSDLDPGRRWFDPGDAFPWALFKAELSR